MVGPDAPKRPFFFSVDPTNPKKIGPFLKIRPLKYLFCILNSSLKIRSLKKPKKISKIYAADDDISGVEFPGDGRVGFRDASARYFWGRNFRGRYFRGSNIIYDLG